MRWAPILVANLFAVGLLASSADAEVVPYRMDASNQAGWWKPIDAVGGNTYVAYNAWGGRSMGGPQDTHTVFVARRAPSGAWTRGCLPAAEGGCAVYRDDIGHHQPTLALDGDGFIHVFAAMHHTGWRYFRSSQPGDPTTMVDRSTEMPDQTGRFTYPNAIRTVTGDVFLIIRDYPVGRLYRWDNRDNTWSHAATFAAEANYVVYPDDIIGDAAGNLHIAWEWAYGGSNGLRHLGSYARYDPTSGRFTDAAGQQLTAPIGINSTAVYQPLETGESSTDRSSDLNPPGFQSAKLVIGPTSGRPMVAYRFRPTAGGRFEVRMAEWDGRDWQRQIVYAGRYTTYAAVDITVQGGSPRVYYAKTDVPSGNQGFAATRLTNGAWVETLLLRGVPVERLAVISRGSVDHMYLSVPAERRLYLETR